jgi:hypothetical protein
MRERSIKCATGRSTAGLLDQQRERAALRGRKEIAQTPRDLPVLGANLCRELSFATFLWAVDAGLSSGREMPDPACELSFFSSQRRSLLGEWILLDVRHDDRGEQGC